MTEELVEKIAEMIYARAPMAFSPWAELTNPEKQLWLLYARGALAAIEASGTHAVAPLNPTESMIVAGCRHENMGDMAGRYAAMLAARPKV